jgi:hypothetical protein
MPGLSPLTRTPRAHEGLDTALVEALRDELERVDVSWSHDGEVAAVERCDRGYAEAFRRRDHGGVNRAEWEIDIGVHQFGHAVEVRGRKRLERERAASKFASERSLGRRADELANEVGGFDDDELRHDKGL